MFPPSLCSCSLRAVSGSHTPALGLIISTQLRVVARNKAVAASQNTLMSIAVEESSVSTDAAVQRTNDDSVVSKRSAVHKGYFDDPYLRFFVKKLSRRSPLINRGYYLRMLVITDVIERCIHHLRCLKIRCTVNTPPLPPTGNAVALPVQVISLGAGYDTLAMRLKQRPDYGNVHFYEVDFPAVMQSKSMLVKMAPFGSFPEDIVADPGGELVKLYGNNYWAVGTDLRSTNRDLVTCLREASPQFSTDNPTVLYAECVMQYMPPVAASQLIKQIASAFPCAVFVAYDQLHPSDSFGTVMLSALRTKNSPLLSIGECPSGAAMVRRAIQQGMCKARFANFHDLSKFYISGDNHDRVEALEPFDEWEEWCEMCEHYGITMATTLSDEEMPDHSCFKEIMEQKEEELCAGLPCKSQGNEQNALRLENWPTGRFGFEGWGNGGAVAERLFSGDVLIISFGGFSVTRGHQRTNTLHVHSLRSGDRKVLQSSLSVEPPSLVFHSMSRVSRGSYVVFGGRTNPQDVASDAYLLRLELPTDGYGEEANIVATWSKLQQTADDGKLPVARYRHAATSVTNSGGDENTDMRNIFVFGGRCATGEFLNDAWLGSVGDGIIHWKLLRLSGDIPPPCCSSGVVDATMGSIVLLSGGLLRGGVSDSSLWSIDWVTGVCNKRDAIVGPRFSHTMCRVSVNGVTGVLVVGGSSTEPSASFQATQILLLDPVSGEITETLKLPPMCPTWTRHSCVALEDGAVGVLGGGFTCFSFGTFATKPLLLLLDGKRGGRNAHSWDVAKLKSTSTSAAANAFSICCTVQRRPVEEQSLSVGSFSVLVNHPFKPVVFRDVDMGCCVKAWSDPAYLNRVEGNTRVSVHVARNTELLDFVTKNFSFQHVSFNELLDHCLASSAALAESGNLPGKLNEERETWYLRAVASNMKSERANIWRDFQGLKDDFVLPSATVDHIKPRMHQACLRISAPPLQLWTHYDTLDNVLCQIVGRKRVVLFPPSEYNNLYISGSSSAVTNIDKPDYMRFPRFIDASRHALEVEIGPGDMLFIPALWFHHVTTLKGSYSMSVNVFFERLPHADYDKKDLYGNKDIPAASRLRAGIVKKVKEMISETAVERTSDGKALTPDLVEFALRQALQDLMEVADDMCTALR
ncbi:hypothetical protein, conserved [Trypanosoma brucei gambiense DAL972]|uniref:tRNA wybutosine-synthesizing protein 4 n=1 Tax=Trypanosoma brucei gambiense (strain MHOM/CI/86/DAL972) TaxID=679716 RepID=C9ZZ58_TRYB9|nr:hypothetical protein, conserved [Trypanosoma brucei gambiense DAL972]CBH14707.1 hypothetical protein, conserved [Trypanosoma brucei gambiense DAL972]|eukprot:XP_011776973.1 hypothetical protein, conserved [Trypanosoma brucei gambiense DAL972]